MPRGPGGKLDRRVVRAAEAALAQRRSVTAIDVLVGLGWLEPRRVDEWRQGRIPYLEATVIASLGKISTAMKVFGQWAAARDLKPSETAYVARTRDRRPLRFSKSGDEGIERAYRTHWVSPELSERRRERLAERQSRPPDLVVVSPVKEWTCSACGSEDGEWLIMEDPGPVCLACADMDHLVFLPSGDAALTRRAKNNSHLSAVVVRFSRARKRYERQGMLVDEDALERAEQECLADEQSRARRRDRDAARRAGGDLELQARMAVEIGKLFPGCPPERADAIARHAAQPGSGRVGRSAAGRALDPEAVELAVLASVRHQDTGYDQLLMCQDSTALPPAIACATRPTRSWTSGATVSSNRHAPAHTPRVPPDPLHERRLTRCLPTAVRHAAPSVQFDTYLRAARPPTHPGPIDPKLALAAQRRQRGPASAGFRSDAKQLSGVSAPPRPTRYGVLAEIELAPSRADCSSRRNAGHGAVVPATATKQCGDASQSAGSRP